MQQKLKNEAQNSTVSTYRETQIEGTIYRVTSVYLGEKDLREALERFVARKVYNELSTRADKQ